MDNENGRVGTGMGNRVQYDPVTRDSAGNLYAPDVREAAKDAVLDGEGAIAQGEGATAVGEGGIFISGNINRVVTYDVAFERVIGSTSFVLKQLELSYQQTREQAQVWFRFSLIAAGIGFLLIGIGVVVVMFGQMTAGLITTISSIIPNAAAALFFVQSKSANERVDSIQTRLTDAREIQSAIDIVNTLDDSKARDKLKSEIVRSILGLEKKNSIKPKP